MLYDYKEYKEKFIDKSQTRSPAFHDYVCTIINLAVGIYVIFFLKLNLIEILLTMIAFDILIWPLNILVMKLVPFQQKQIRKMRKAHFDKLPLAQKKEYVQNLLDKCEEKRCNRKINDDYVYNYTSYFCDMHNLITECQEDINNYKNELKNNNRQLSDIVKNRNESDLEEVIKIINNLSNTKEEYPKWISSKLDEILDKSYHIVEAVKKDPMTISVIFNTYNIYIKELNNILIQYINMSKEDKSLHRDNIKTIMDRFDSHCDKLITKMNRAKNADIKRDIDVLMSVLDEDDEKED